MPHQIDIYVGQVLAERRKSVGLSQHEVGVRVGVTFQQMQKYERGVNRISASRLWDICEVLELDISDVSQDDPSHLLRCHLWSDNPINERCKQRPFASYDVLMKR